MPAHLQRLPADGAGGAKDDKGSGHTQSLYLNLQDHSKDTVKGTEKRQNKDNAVEAVQHTAVSRHQLAVILDAHLALDQRQGKVTDLSHCRTGKAKKDEVYQYQSGNETIIQPINLGEGRGVGSIWNLIIGIGVGLAVAWFLILPARIQNAKADVNEEMKVVSEQLDVKSATISELESKVKTLESEKEKLTGQLQEFVGAGGTLDDIDNLLQAVRIYLETPEEIMEMNNYLENINPESVTEESSRSFRELYELLLSQVGEQLGAEYYRTGMDAYQVGDYETAVTELTRAAAYDADNVDAYFNLANAYRKLEQSEEAIEVYQKVIELFPSNEKASRSQSYINELSPQE